MIYNNLGITTGSTFPTQRAPLVRGPIINRPTPVAVQIGGFNGGPGPDVFVNGNISSSCNCLSAPVTEVNTTPYTPTASDYFLCVDIDDIAVIILPTSTIGRIYIVKDCDGDAEANPITITATGTTIDGSPSATINTNYGSLNFIFNGTEWNVF